MGTADRGDGPRKLDLGRVAVEMLAVIRRQGRILVPLSLAFVLAPAIVATFVWSPIAAATLKAATTAASALWLAFCLSLVAMVFATFGAVTQVGVALADLEAKRPELRAVLRLALQKRAPALGASVLFSLCIVLGSFLFAVPELMLTLA